MGRVPCTLTSQSGREASRDPSWDSSETKKRLLLVKYSRFSTLDLTVGIQHPKMSIITHGHNLLSSYNRVLSFDFQTGKDTKFLSTYCDKSLVGIVLFSLQHGRAFNDDRTANTRYLRMSRHIGCRKATGVTNGTSFSFRSYCI